MADTARVHHCGSDIHILKAALPIRHGDPTYLIAAEEYVTQSYHQAAM